MSTQEKKILVFLGNFCRYVGRILEFLFVSSHPILCYACTNVFNRYGIAAKVHGNHSMFRLNDLILVLVLAASISGGIFFPDEVSFFQPYPIYGMMFFLFLSFLSIKIEHIWSTIRTSAGAILLLTALKMVALPVIVYYLFEFFWPEYALAALLLSGVSTGVVAPFVANLVNANSPLVIVLVVLTSPLLPFTLPLLVKVLVGESINISLDAMIRMLSMVIFIPIIAVEVLRRTSPKLMQFILDKRFPISLTLFSLINLGVFSKYSAFFRQNPTTLFQATLVALVLGGIYLLAGVLPLWRLPLDDQIAGGVIMADINNVLVIVFASQFFGPIEPTVAAMYMLPFFLVIVPLRFYRIWRRNYV